MTLLIWDQIRRRWLGYVLGCAGYGVLLAMYSRSDAFISTASLLPAVFMVVTSNAAFANRGLVRTLLAVPVTPRQIGRSWWGTAVGIPSFLLAVVTGVVFVYSAIFRHNPASTVAFFYYWLTGALMFGALFFCVTHICTLHARTGVKRLWDGLVNIVLLEFTVFLVILNLLIPPLTMKWDICLAVALVLTIGGWLSAEAFVRNSAGFGLVSRSPSSPSAKPSRYAEGQGGFPYLLQLTVSGLALGGIAINGFFILGYGIMSLFPSSHSGIEASIPDELFIFYSYFPACLVAQLCIQLRILRTLPISTSKLAAILVLLPLSVLPLVSHLGRLFSAVVFRLPLNVIDWQYDFLPFAAVAIFVPALVCRGGSLWIIISFLMMLALSLSETDSVAAHLSSLAGGGISLLLACSSFIVTKLLLERSDSAYQPRVSSLFGGERPGTELPGY